MRLVFALALSLAACGAPPLDAELIGRTDLAALSIITPVGVTAEPDTDRIYVLDADLGIYDLDSGENIFDATAPFAQIIQGTFTDLVALGNDRFALTARNEGFLFDRAAQTLTRHFCYLPGWAEDIPFVHQQTESVTYDPETQIIYAQPQTFEDDVVVDSHVGTFDAFGGGDLSWHATGDMNLLAGGIAFEAPGTLLLAADDQLMRYTLSLESLEPVGALDLERVEGLALADDRLYAIDGAKNELVVWAWP